MLLLTPSCCPSIHPSQKPLYHSFANNAPHIWTKFPDATTLASFRSKLNSYMFSKANISFSFCAFLVYPFLADPFHSPGNFWQLDLCTLDLKFVEIKCEKDRIGIELNLLTYNVKYFVSMHMDGGS